MSLLFIEVGNATTTGPGSACRRQFADAQRGVNGGVPGAGVRHASGGLRCHG